MCITPFFLLTSLHEIVRKPFSSKAGPWQQTKMPLRFGDPALFLFRTKTLELPRASSDIIRKVEIHKPHKDGKKSE